ncbi:MAG: citrate synthase [Deltaproteobacteria bacterium]
MADSLTITDNRTGQQYELPIQDNTINASDLQQIRVDDETPGLASFDPALANTAACKSAVSFIDGERGILRYRGYPIEEIAERSSYLETAYLIVKGELPSPTHFAMWQHNIKMHTIVHENVKGFIEGFRYDAHPMGILLGTIGALSTFYPEARDINDPESRRVQTRRLIAKLPTIAAMAFRHSRGLPYVLPDNELSYTGNFLSMLFKMTELKYRPDPVLEHALDVLFILHADHEQNCSATTARTVGSSHADPYSVVAAAAAALSGPRHGGANEDVVRMLREIGSVSRVAERIKSVKNGEGRLMGFGHRVYKNHDPRAQIIKQIAYQVFEVTGKNPIIDIALEMERIALEDEYFIKRKLYPNVDFYSGIIYEAMGFPLDMFTVLFAIARTSGWVAQWAEALEDENMRIVRPKQIYVGAAPRSYTPLDQRQELGPSETEVHGPL